MTKMNKALLTLLFISLSVPIAAQSQHGYTKTKGRLNPDGSVSPGRRIPEVVISFEDRRNSVISDKNGNFSFPVRENTYVIASVIKNGYELLDPEILGRKLHSSINEPLVLALCTPDEKLDEQLACERTIRRKLEKTLDLREAELDSLKASQAISAEEYRSRLQQLFDDRTRSEKLVKDMAERYSEIDFDEVDNFYRQVSTCILNGDLFKADSLLTTLNEEGSLDERIASYRALEAANRSEEEQLSRRRRDLERSRDFAGRTLQILAQECYSRYEIDRLRFRNDSAAYYLEKRAALDTTNVGWQVDAGAFICDYLADMPKALAYFQRALRHSASDLQKAGNYNNLGSLYSSTGQYDEALTYLKKADEIYKSLNVEQNPDDDVLNNTGYVYYRKGEYGKAKECYEAALHIRQKKYGSQSLPVANSYNNIGVTYTDMGDYPQALEYIEKSIAIKSSLLEKKNVDIADGYENLGIIYYYTGDYQNALYNICKAFDIRKELFGERHPKIASSCNMLGILYSELGEDEKALTYYEKALTIHMDVYGEIHPSVANINTNLGILYLQSGNFTKGIHYLNAAASILTAIHGENHPDVASIYSNIGAAYNQMGSYTEAFAYHEKALAIFQAVYGENHPSTASCYNNLGNVFMNTGNINKAIEYYNKTLSIREVVFGKNHPETARVHLNLGSSYNTVGEYGKAMEHCKEAENILQTLYEGQHPLIASVYSVIGNIYLNLSEYDKAIENQEKAIEIDSEAYGESSPSQIGYYANSGIAWHKLRNYPKAIECHEKALEIGLTCFGEDNKSVGDSYYNLGDCWKAAGDNPQALKYFEKALTIYKKLLPHDDKEIIELEKAIAGLRYGN